MGEQGWAREVDFEVLTKPSRTSQDEVELHSIYVGGLHNRLASGGDSQLDHSNG